MSPVASGAAVGARPVPFVFILGAGHSFWGFPPRALVRPPLGTCSGTTACDSDPTTGSASMKSGAAS